MTDTTTYYYDVAPADRSYQGNEPLTYSHPNELLIGQIIVVKVRTKRVRAFVLRSVKKPSFKAKAIDEVLENMVLPTYLIEGFEWLRQYYPASYGSLSSTFLPVLPAAAKKNGPINAVNIAANPTKLPGLTNSQQRILHDMISSKTTTHIVHGDTGTGKTRLYMEFARKLLANKKSLIVMTPEISLTPQIAKQFSEQFSNVIILHSGVSEAKRKVIWHTLLTSQEPQIIIGPRSSLFAPLHNIGAVIIDEFHDQAYKQTQMPRYNALRLAATLCRNSGAKLVLGSATPPIDDYYYAQKSGASVHRLTEKPATQIATVDTQIIVLSDQNEQSNRPLLSKSALASIRDSLTKKQQVMVFLNKRGTSRLVLCEDCGWTATCKRCDIPYTYHHDSHLLTCHTCGQTETPPNSCPTCRSSNIFFKKPGTKAIEDNLKQEFPQAEIRRYDKDNKKSESFSEHHDEIMAGDVDILVGTQLLTKGHDLPRLGLVIVCLGEDSLQFPDYQAAERTFQLLHQIRGRLGRSDVNGRLLLQTFSDSNELLEYASHSEDSWQTFYEQQLLQRREFNYPPFRYLLKISVSRKTEKSSFENIQKIYNFLLAKNFTQIEVLGPSPAFKFNEHGTFNYQILVKAERRSTLLLIISHLPKSCIYDIDPLTTL